MCLLFETIRVVDGRALNLPYHQQRVNRYSTVNLMSYINSCVITPESGLYKLRITYSESSIHSYEIDRYIPKKIESLKIIVDNDIDYHMKFNDRTSLNNLIAQRGDCDDILIIKRGLVSDISFANVVFFDGEKWVTPSTPLLEGSCRARLIFQNIITPQPISYDDLKLFSHFMIINAMLDFDLARALTYSLSDGCVIAGNCPPRAELRDCREQ